MIVLALWIAGLIWHLLQSWKSVTGDLVWVVGGLLFALAAIAEPGVWRESRSGLLSRIAFILLGLIAALTMVYWALYDGGRIARIGRWWTTVPSVVLGVIGLAAWWAANRRPRDSGEPG